MMRISGCSKPSNNSGIEPPPDHHRANKAAGRASARPTKSAYFRDIAASDNGFTLLELLVALAILALITGLGAPSIRKMIDSVEYATQHDKIIADINRINYRAFKYGVTINLNKASLDTILPDGEKILNLPEGWRLEIISAIRYEFTGQCTGGEIELISPTQHNQKIRLEAPTCHVRTESN